MYVKSSSISGFERQKTEEQFEFDSTFSQEYNILLNSTHGVYRSPITGRIAYHEAFLRKYFIFHNEAHFLSYIQKIKKIESQYEPVHLLNIIDNTEDFLRQKDFYQKSLLKTLQLDDQALNYEKESLDLIEDHLPKGLDYTDPKSRELFVSLLSYTGHMYYHHRNAEWSFRFDPEINSFWPVDQMYVSDSSFDWARELEKYLFADSHFTSLRQFIFLD